LSKFQAYDAIITYTHNENVIINLKHGKSSENTYIYWPRKAEML